MSNTTASPIRKMFAILRVGKIPDWATLRRVSNHNTRTVVSENVQDNRPPPRELLEEGSDDFVASARERMIELGIDPASAKDKIVAVEAVVSASKAWFAQASEQQKAAWRAASLKWARGLFGRGLLTAKEHLDEETPHIHFVAVPVFQKRRLRRGRKPKHEAARKLREQEDSAAPLVWTLSYHDILGGKADRLSKEQDAYQAFVADLGLERGERQREPTAIELGDELTLEVERYSRGQDADGRSRPRRSVPPAEYRAIIKRLQAEVAHLREEVATARIEADRDRRAALAARHDAEAMRTVIAQNAERSALLRDAAQLDRIAAAEALAKAGAERQALADRQQLHEAQLALLARAADDAAGLDLQSTGDGLSMRQDDMSSAERSAYRHPWTGAVLAIGRRLAEALELTRRHAARLLQRERAVETREAAIEARHAARQAEHEAAVTAIRQREAVLKTGEAEAARRLADADARLNAATKAASNAEATLLNQHAWEKAVGIIVKNPDLIIGADDDTIKIDPARAAEMPGWFAKTVNAPAPAWARTVIDLQRKLMAATARADQRERQAEHSANHLEALVQGVGPLLAPAQKAAATEAKRAVRNLGPTRQRERDGRGM